MKTRILLMLGLFLSCSVLTVAMAGTTEKTSVRTGLRSNFTWGHTGSHLSDCTDSVYVSNTTSGGTGNNVYTWYFGDGYSVTTTSTDVIGHKYAYAGSYNIQLNVIDNNRNYSTKTITITTTGTAASVSAKSAVYGPTYTDTTGAVLLNGGNSTSSYGTLNYLWTLTTGSHVTTYSTQNVSFSVNRSTGDSAYTAVLKVTDVATGCRQSTDTVHFTINRFVASLSPNFSTSNTASVLDHCADSVIFTNTTSGGAGSQSYTWYFGDGGSYTTSSKAAFGHKYINAGPFNVQLSVTDSARGTVTVTKSVSTTGTAPAIIARATSYGPTYTDTTGTVLLNGGNSSVASGTGTYLWTLTGGTTFATQNATYVVNRTNADQSFTAKLKVSDVTGCRADSATVSFTINKLVPALTVNFSTSNTTSVLDHCADSVIFTNTTSGGA
ncbi:MAG: PKD domain-containing protein, partial [Bacteroidota bacterium]